MPVTVKFQIDVLVCGLQGHLFPSFDVGPMFTWNRNKSHEQSRIVEIQLLATSSLCGLEAGLPAFHLPMFAKRDALPKRGLCDMFV